MGSTTFNKPIDTEVADINSKLTSIYEYDSTKRASGYPIGIFAFYIPVGTTINGVTTGNNVRGMAYNTGLYLHFIVSSVSAEYLYMGGWSSAYGWMLTRIQNAQV